MHVLFVVHLVIMQMHVALIINNKQAVYSVVKLWVWTCPYFQLKLVHMLSHLVLFLKDHVL